MVEGKMGLIEEWKAMLKGMAQGAYPEFVTGREIGSELPVFSYHRVQANVFKSHLNHLRRNGYKTLDIRQALSLVESGQPLVDKHVLLTFDDGLSDLYTVVYPLLKEYEMKAVSFIAPYWIGSNGLITWEQALEMHSSGHVDFQSHGFSHRRIPVSPEIAGFYHPKMRLYRKWQLPMSDGVFRTNDRPLWGLPIFRSQSCLSDALQYLGGTDVERDSLEQVENAGKDRFFRDPFWKKKLYRTVQSHRESRTPLDRYETRPEQYQRIRQEVAESKASIEKHLQGKRVLAFSCPFNESGGTAERVFREQDFRFIFGGIGKKSEWRGGMMYLRRTSGDFVLRLPGRGRKTLICLFAEKTVRRIRVGPGY